MKKILKITLYSLLGIIVLIFAGLYLSYWMFSPGDKGVTVNEADLVYFQESYNDCRQSFLAEAKIAVGQYDNAELFSINVPSSVDQDLYIDLLYLPPVDSAGKLLVMSSGVHGVEGFTGSATQQMFLKELLSSDVLSEMGLLIIHGVNPYGFKYLRRVSENNVDLNRGSEIDPVLFESKNPGYGALYDMLNPQTEYKSGSLRNQFFYLIAISKMIKESMSVLRQAVLQGQYEYPEGLYFGGTDFEPQIDSLQRILPGYFESYKTILEIDLHTGYGARRVLHLFPNPVDDPDIKKKTESVFEGHSIDWG
ncbi:M14 family metallopeptidase, partial [Bacteroidota bacterium]